MPRRDIRYDLVLSYELTRAGDIDIVAEDHARLDPRLSESPLEALGVLGSFISLNGGPEAWEQVDPYEIASCWLPNDGDGSTEISYRARLERVTLPPGAGTLAIPATRDLAMLTWNRVNAASSGELGWRTPGEIDEPDAGGEP